AMEAGTSRRLPELGSRSSLFRPLHPRYGMEATLPRKVAMVVLAGASALRSAGARSVGDVGNVAALSWLAARLDVPVVAMPVGHGRVLADLWRGAAPCTIARVRSRPGGSTE
ncbi:MAG: hypothetical protein ACO3QC_08780, partial [Phycisphaerales bacterium]